MAVLLATLAVLLVISTLVGAAIAASPAPLLGPYTDHLFLLLTLATISCAVWTLVRGGRRLKQQGRLRRAVVFAVYLVVIIPVGLDAVLEMFPRLIPQRVLSNLPFGGHYFFPKGTRTHEFRRDLGMKPWPNTNVEILYVNDLVHYGQISPIYDYPTTRILYRTDSRGFRNSDEATTADVVALGDSFTELPYLPIEEVWPSLVARRTGWRIRNLATSGYGTTQQAMVLRQWGLAYRPRLVVLAFYEGNDILECAEFERFRRSGLDYPMWIVRQHSGPFGWFDRRPVVAVLRLGLLPYQRIVERQWGQDARSRALRRSYFNPLEFEAGGQRQKIGLFSAHLRLLSEDREKVRSQAGWPLCQQTLRDMKKMCEGIGAAFAVVYVPTKEHVYLPLLRGRFTAEALHDFVASFHAELAAMSPDKFEAALFANMEETERAVGEFCRAESIPYLDLTSPFRDAAENGEMVYFAFDCHWNRLGNQRAAEAIERFLREAMSAKPRP